MKRVHNISIDVDVKDLVYSIPLEVLVYEHDLDLLLEQIIKSYGKQRVKEALREQDMEIK